MPEELIKKISKSIATADRAWSAGMYEMAYRHLKFILKTIIKLHTEINNNKKS